MSTRDNLVSVEDRILLYLLRRNSPKYKFNVPFALTHQGIAESIHANYSYVSIPLNNLIKKGHIHECTGHVKFEKRKRRYFILTDKGKEYTSKLSMKLSNEQIVLKLLDNSEKVMLLDDAIQYLIEEGKCPGITEMDVFAHTTKEKLLDFELLKKNKKMKIVDFSSEAPTLLYFYGRKKELATLRNWIDDENYHNIILIHGIAGIGKTTLAAKLLEHYRNTRNLFWHDLHELDTPRSVLLRLAEFLTELGSSDLELQLRKHTKLDMLEISRTLTKSIGSLDAILVFDNFHRTDEKIRILFVYLQKILALPSKTKLLILSREIVPFYDLRKVIKTKTVAELKLEGLDFESSKRLLKGKDIEKDKFEEIYNFTGGNPLFLEIIESKDSIDRYLYELFSNIAEKEKNILEIISVYRYPVQEECLISSGDFGLDTLFGLTQKSIVKKDAYDRFLIHDIIKCHFYKKMLPSKRKDYHLSAARWFYKRENPTDILEAIYHYQSVEDYENASKLLISYSPIILESGYAYELLAILDTFDEKSVDGVVRADIMIIKGKANKVCGEWKKALLYFGQSEDIALSINDRNLQVRAITESGHILEEQNEIEKAMNFFKKGLNISKDINYFSGMGDCYRGIGRAYWRKSEHDDAIMNLKKSLEISERLGDMELMASINIDLGNIYDERYEIKEAVKCYNTSLDILKKIKNTYETARVYGNLAITYEHLEDFKKAIEYNTKLLELAQNLHDMILLGYGYAGMGYCCAKIDEYEKARQYTEKAEKIALKLENDNIMNLLNKTYGLISKYEGRWNDGEEYFNRNLIYLKNLGASYQLPDSHLELGLLYKEVGDSINSKRHIDVAMKLYTDLGLENNEHVKEKLSKC